MPRHRVPRLLAVAAGLLLFVPLQPAQTEEEAADSPPATAPDAAELPLVPSEVAPGVPLEAHTTAAPASVIGPEPTRALRRLPGSGSVVDASDILVGRETTSVQDAMRGLPGVIVRPEVGSGIIPNIGIRGLNPDRSEKMLVLEDGIPAGLAPYIENASYYIPPFERMHRIELLKGSGSIVHGPHTVGGVLNLITPPVPWCDGCVHGRVRTAIGTDGYRMGQFDAGQRVGSMGWLVQGVAKRGDGWRDESEFEFIDLTAKVRWQVGSRTNVTFKFNVYDSTSQDTYLGLTQGMYEADAYQNPVRDDKLEVEWYGAHLMLEHQLSCCWDLVSHVYWSKATRDWNRQDFARNTGFAPAPANTIATVGDTAIDGGAIYLRESYGSRDREFDKWGIETRLVGRHALFGRSAEMQVGVRFHTEEMIDERNNRAFLQADPVLRTRDRRQVDAWSAFVLERIDVTRNFTLSAGIRLEAFESRLTREITNALPDGASGSTDNVEWIPGAGFAWRFAPTHTLFGGVHRGFSPPRTAQAIAADGTDLELDAERSWNYELGVRGQACCWLDYELTAFYYDFSNQVVPDNESGGTSTEVVNAGETRHMGLEGKVAIDLTRAIVGRRDMGRTAVFLEFGGTLLDTENTTSGGLFEGNELPYAPNESAFGSVRVDWPSGFSLGSTVTYTGAQFADQDATVAPSADGQRGEIESRFLVDVRASYRAPRSCLTLTAAAINVFDETYIASRAPEGIFPGLPRHFFFGAELDF